MILYGTGGHAKVVVDILDSIGIEPELVVDHYPKADLFMGFPVAKDTGRYESAIIAIGSNEIRKKVVAELDVDNYPNAIHKSAIVSKHASVGHGSVVMQGAVVQSCAEVGDHCIINTGATVDHDCRLGDFVHIAPNSTLCGNVEVGEGSWIGAGSVVKQGVKIGAWSIIGAGSVVVNDVPDHVVAVGNKCKVINHR
jgi:sugar O-acyltransferase (sialic acid O-acetyltransferase NeuD family)